MLPAELLALGIPLGLPLYGFLPAAERTAPLLFDLICDGGSLFVGYHEPAAAADSARGAAAAALGWEPAHLLPSGAVPPVPGPRRLWRTDLAVYGWGRTEMPPAAWRIDAGGPGEVRAAQAADMIVRTAEAAGMVTVSNLRLGAEGEHGSDFDFAFPGLGLRTG